MTEIWHSIENLETVSDLFSPKSIECDAKENHEKERQIPGGKNGAKVMKTALKSETCLGLINNRLEKVNGLVKVYVTIFKLNIVIDVVFLQWMVMWLPAKQNLKTMTSFAIKFTGLISTP